jgi:hypothetical protein
MRKRECGVCQALNFKPRRSLQDYYQQYTATYATHMIPARPKASTNLCDPQDCFRTHQALKPTPPRLALVERIDAFKYSALLPSFRLTPSPQHVTSVNFVSSPRASAILRPIKQARIHLLQAKCWYNKRMNPNTGRPNPKGPVESSNKP